jgi:hypothetical protein
MNIKLMVVGVVGYILGRTRKGKAALKFALWAGGHDASVKSLARAQAVRLAESEEGRKLVAQLRGPVLASGRKVALSAYERRVGSLAENLARRTSELRRSLDERPPAELGGMAGVLTDAVSDAFSGWGARRGQKTGHETSDEESSGAGGGESSSERAEATAAADDRPAREPEGTQRQHAGAGQHGEVTRGASPGDQEEAGPTTARREPGRRAATRAPDRRPPSRHRPVTDRREAADSERARAKASTR